jgi:hypothetical protein
MMFRRHNHYSDYQMAGDENGGMCGTYRGGETCSLSFHGKTEYTTFWRPKCRWQGNTQLTPKKYDAWPGFIRVVIGHN